MKEQPVLQFTDDVKLGKVSAVDTSRVLIAIENPILLPRAAVGTLVAIQGATAQEYLIGMTERVTRQLREQVSAPDPLFPSQLNMEIVPDDALRTVLLGTFKSVDGRVKNKFKRGADSFPQIDRDCFLIEGGNLQRFMNLMGSELAEEERLVLGHFVLDSEALAIANGDKLFQRHAAILGSTGSGKSFAVAMILERAAKRKNPNIIVFDMHGEYASLTKGEDADQEAFASRFKIAGPADLKAPGDEVIFLPYWVLNREEMMSMLLDRTDSNAPNQASRFSTHVQSAKEAVLRKLEKPEVLASFTVDSPIPYSMDAVMGQLQGDDKAMVEGARAGTEKQGDWFGKLTRFTARLEAKMKDRRYGFMFSPSSESMDYGWLARQAARLIGNASGSGIKIIDFSEVPSDVLPVVTAVFARLIYDIQFWMDPVERTPFVVVCDEAHLYLPVKEDASASEKQALASFERIAKEGRKYGVSLLVVSQRPSDVSKTILSQCNNFLVLRLTNDQDQSVVKRLLPDSLAGMLDGLPLLDTGEALLLGDAILLPARIKLQRPSLEPLSATRNFWTEWGDGPAETYALEAAVETLRRQSR